MADEWSIRAPIPGDKEGRIPRPGYGFSLPAVWSSAGVVAGDLGHVLEPSLHADGVLHSSRAWRIIRPRARPIALRAVHFGRFTRGGFVGGWVFGRGRGGRGGGTRGGGRGGWSGRPRGGGGWSGGGGGRGGPGWGGRWSVGLIRTSQGVVWMIVWWWRQSRTRLCRAVTPPSAQCLMWWASQAIGGRVQAGNAQCRSRVTSANQR